MKFLHLLSVAGVEILLLSKISEIVAMIEVSTG